MNPLKRPKKKKKQNGSHELILKCWWVNDPLANGAVRGECSQLVGQNQRWADRLGQKQSYAAQGRLQAFQCLKKRVFLDVKPLQSAWVADTTGFRGGWMCNYELVYIFVPDI